MIEAPPWVVSLAEEGLSHGSGPAGHVKLASVVHDRRPNSDLYWCTADGGAKVLVKQGRNWDAETGEDLHRSLNRLLARLVARGAPVTTAEPLASRASPPGICLAVVDGLPAKRLMRGEIETMSDAVRSAMPESRLLALARLSGIALGWYHEVHLDDLDEAAVATAQRAFDNLRSTRLLRRVGTVVPAVSADDVSFSWNDFGFHNVLVTPDERACLLDVPPRPEPRVIHRDVARGLAELSERYRARHGPWIPPRLRAGVAASFVDGYASVAGRHLQTAHDELLVRFHETQTKISRARRKVKARDWVEAVPALGVAAKSYRALSRH